MRFALSLSLKTAFLSSVLERSEALLLESKHQRGLRLVKVLGNGMRFRSTLDFLAAVFAPALLPHIKAHYAGTGENLAGLFSEDFIDRFDRMLVIAIQHLGRVERAVEAAELKEWETKEVLALIEVEGLRPLFPAVPGLDKDRASAV